MIRIINTGGTFNKRYDPIKGELVVPSDNRAIESIVKVLNTDVVCEGIIYKDSLEMCDEDRQELAEKILASRENAIVIVHGTDTMDISAAYVNNLKLDKIVIFTGAMVPFEIDPIEATANVSMALAVASLQSSGVYIVMQGVIGAFDKVKKNRERGIFEYV